MAKKRVRPVQVDFETFGIESRPFYPPIPAGVAIKYPGKKGRYYAWGHASDNNCSYDEALTALREAWEWPDGVCFHHGKFDMDVAEIHMGLPLVPWQRYHDTLFLLFLDDPHQKTMALKPASERLFNLPPDERDAVADWLVEHQPVPGVKISKSKSAGKGKSQTEYFAKFLPYAPGSLVGEYAIGDVERAEKIFDLLYTKTLERGMERSYDRERRLVEVLIDMERDGMPIDTKRLAADVKKYSGVFDLVSKWIIHHIETEDDINLDSADQLMAALLASKKIDETKLAVTPGGKYSTSKEALAEAVRDDRLRAMIQYRSQLATSLRTFMEPWLKTALTSGGLIFTTWNQTLGSEKGGTRTGRFSSTPNFQNIPKEFKPIWRHEQSDPTKAKKLPTCPIKDLPSLPMCRDYIAAPKGFLLMGRDFSSQELRVLAHFEDEDMKRAYLENPKLDLHQYAAETVTREAGIEIDRDKAKGIAFGILYGLGIPGLATKLGCSTDEARAAKEAYLNTFPGVRLLLKEIMNEGKNGGTIRTWGGREYFREPSRLLQGRMVDFSYKLINYLIQGSSADLTKDAMIDFYHASKQRGTGGKLLCSVHDELIAIAPVSSAEETMAILKDAMNATRLDVPMLSDGEMGQTWTTMKEHD